jgi:pimeloyl-ACP methyl ester carboxylesterase
MNASDSAHGWHGFERDGVSLWGRDVGQGPAVVFQHGLTASEAQTAALFPDEGAGVGVRRLTLDCRGHGRSGQGAVAGLSIDAFARDVLAFADRQGVGCFVAGGLSMGAALALRLAHLVPERVTGLVLVRPAWAWQAAPANMAPFTELARWLRQPDPAEARRGFDASPTAEHLRREAPDNLASLHRLFDAPDRLATADLIGAIARDGPGLESGDLQRLRVPTLVIGHGVDAVHPLATAALLADRIPGARLQHITPKAADLSAHLAELRQALQDFLTHLPPNTVD